jgi:hypothetical protein
MYDGHIHDLELTGFSSWVGVYATKRRDKTNYCCLVAVVMMYLVGNKQSLPPNVDPGIPFVTSINP